MDEPNKGELNYSLVNKFSWKENDEIDIVGISIFADEELIQQSCDSYKKVNIFYHSEKDKKDYANFIEKNEITNIKLEHNELFFNH